MEQIEELIEEIDRLCERIWNTEKVNIQEIGIFVQTLYQSLMRLLPIIVSDDVDEKKTQRFMMGISHIMEGLKYNDQMLLADAFYYEIRDVLEEAVENGV